MIHLIRKYYPFIPLLLFCVFYTYKACFFATHDFANYYFGAHFLKEELFTTDIYFPHYFNKTIFDLGYQNIFVSYAPNTPFLSILFYPFSLLDLAISKLIFNILSTSLFLFSLIRLTNYFKIKKEYLLLIPIIFFIPLKNNILFGQVYFLLFFLLSEGFLAYKKKHYKSMAVFWGFAIFLKVFPIILAAFLLLRKEFKPLKYLVFGCVILLMISISLSGFEIWKFYFTKVLPRANNGEIAGAFVDNYQSIFMLLKRLFIFDELYNKSVILDNPKLFKALIIFIKVTILGIAYSLTKNKKNSLFTFSFWLLASILLSPYGSTYSFILLLFLYFSITRLNLSLNEKVLWIGFIFCISNSTFPRGFNFPVNYIRLFILLIFLSIIILQYKSNIDFKKIGITSLLIAIISLIFNSKKTKTDYFLTEEMPILTYDYSITNNTLSYNHWNENGENIIVVNTKIVSFNNLNVTIFNNQVYYNDKQLTFDNANKIKPIIINKNLIVFLSDKNRGIGFYELRKINIDK